MITTNFTNKVVLGGTMKKLIFGIFIMTQFLRPLLFAGSDVLELKQEGQLVSIRIVKGEPLRIFVIGKEEAKLDLSSLELTVRRLKPYPGRTLTTSLQDGYFIISEPSDLKETTDIAVTTKIKNKSETLRFKIKNRLP